MSAIRIPRRQLPFCTVAGGRAVWDFASGQGEDRSGSGYDLVVPAGALFADEKARLSLRLNGRTEQVGTASAAAIPSNAAFAVLAWVIPHDFAQGAVFSRGQDGFGAGWSVSLSILDTGLANAATVESSTATTSASSQKVRVGEWNALGFICQRTFSVEPSHLTFFQDGSFYDRKGYEGRSAELRSSTVGIKFGELNGTLAKNISVGRVSVFDVAAGLTEEHAKAMLFHQYLMEKNYFTARFYQAPMVAAAAAASLSINSITASNITQTGARITLGLTR